MLYKVHRKCASSDFFFCVEAYLGCLFFLVKPSPASFFGGLLPFYLLMDSWESKHAQTKGFDLLGYIFQKSGKCEAGMKKTPQKNDTNSWSMEAHVYRIRDDLSGEEMVKYGE